jgi:hypothetical protein
MNRKIYPGKIQQIFVQNSTNRYGTRTLPASRIFEDKNFHFPKIWEELIEYLLHTNSPLKQREKFKLNSNLIWFKHEHHTLDITTKNPSNVWCCNILPSFAKVSDEIFFLTRKERCSTWLEVVASLSLLFCDTVTTSKQLKNFVIVISHEERDSWFVSSVSETSEQYFSRDSNRLLASDFVKDKNDASH